MKDRQHLQINNKWDFFVLHVHAPCSVETSIKFQTLNPEWDHYFVLQVCALWRLNWRVHPSVLLRLLPQKIIHVRIHADVILLWLHGLRQLWVLPHAGDSGVSSFLALCPAYLSLHQVRLRSNVN